MERSANPHHIPGHRYVRNRNTMVKNLLVIDYGTTDWYSVFRGCTISTGEEPESESIRVEQCGWQDLTLISSSETGAHCLLRGSGPEAIFPQQKSDRLFRPDFVLVRNFPMNLHGQSYRNVLLGLLFANVPGVNAPSAVLTCSDKPHVYGLLCQVRRALASEGIDFPLIPQLYFPNISSSREDTLLESEHELQSQSQSGQCGGELLQRRIQSHMPLVAKVGTIHSGYGKAKVATESELHDLRSCLLLTEQYYTMEPFIADCVYDLRLQVIGDRMRVYKRQSDSGWKHNWGNLKFESVDTIDPRHRAWMQAVQRMMPGLDMFALDVMHTADGREYIIELNDTAMGLMYEHETEDTLAIRDLVLKRMNETFLQCK